MLGTAPPGEESLLIKGGTVVTRLGRERANVLIRGGRIEILTTSSPNSDEVIDATGLLVMPGVVDPHVHFRQPGMHSEDWENGSRAALAGGVTTVLDMPNTCPPTTTLQLLLDKFRMVDSSSPLVNYGFHFGATPTNAEEIRAAGLSTGALLPPPPGPLAASVKVFMGSSTGDLLITELTDLRNVARTSRIMTVHAEDEAVIRMHASEQDHALRRPKRAALAAIRKLLSVGRAGSIYVCHVTSYEEAELASPFYREATPHHLFLNSEAMREIGAYAKVNPPLRAEPDRASLWRALLEGKIDAIGSDHAPHLRSEKESADPPSGVPGVETSLPLMVDASMKGLIRLEEVVRLMSYSPAKIFRIRGKGDIAPGKDADLVLVDPKLERKVDPDALHYKCGWTPYDGMALRGWPVVTLVGGSVAYKEGEFYPVKGSAVRYGI
ncbi:MAG: dihydroorotase [Candidatus Verstraetearchaeota archaeon]|nr:dihydroorotase [Candidatus Verstraetearchaeota archaeon]